MIIDPENPDNLPIKRHTVTTMVAAWRKNTTAIRTAFLMVDAAVKELDAVFGQSGHWIRIDRHSFAWDRPDEVVEHMKRDAWAAFVNRMGLRQVLSIKAAQALDQQIRDGKDIPEFTESELLAILDGTLQNIPAMIEEAVHEVFEWLRPHRSQYKTNTEFEIGERVIVSWTVEKSWSGNGFRVHYGQSEARIRALDNVFHMLDGKGTIATHGGPLMDAINKTDSTGIGETEYFKFRCCANRNLHIAFKRMDLVRALNAKAGGLRLKPEGVGR